MIDGTDLLSLSTVTRFHIGETTAKFWTADDIYAAVNAERVRLCRKIIGLNNGYMEQIVTPTLAATITLPTNCYVVRNVELYIDGAWMQPRWIKDHDRGQYQSTGTTFPGAVQFYNNTVVFENGTGGASSVRIKYARLPSDMIYQTLSSGSTTTMVLNSGAFLDDAYNDDQFIVLDGTGIGEVLTASDYVASTKTLTVAATATLDSTTVISTLLSEPLANWKDLVALGAALRLLPRNRDDNRAGMLRSDYERDLEDMVESLSQRQSEQAQHGNYIPTGDDE